MAARLATDAASVMFTSGSTGEPKGVIVPHRAIVRLCRNNRFFSAGPDTRFLHISSLAFDVARQEMARHHNLAGWRRVLEGLAEEVRVDAGHMEMWREPHARTLAHTPLEHIREAAVESGAIGVAIVDKHGADAPCTRIT